MFVWHQFCWLIIIFVLWLFTFVFFLMNQRVKNGQIQESYGLFLLYTRVSMVSAKEYSWRGSHYLFNISRIRYNVFKIFSLSVLLCIILSLHSQHPGKRQNMFASILLFVFRYEHCFATKRRVCVHCIHTILFVRLFFLFYFIFVLHSRNLPFYISYTHIFDCFAHAYTMKGQTINVHVFDTSTHTRAHPPIQMVISYEAQKQIRKASVDIQC